MTDELRKHLILAFASERWCWIDESMLLEETRGLSLKEAIDRIDEQAIRYGLQDPLDPMCFSPMERTRRELMVSAIRKMAEAESYKV